MQLARSTHWLVALVFLAFLNAGPALAQEGAADDPSEKLRWIKGPSEGKLSDRASIPFGKDFRFLGAADAHKLLVARGNRVRKDEVLGLLEHSTDSWWVVFEFDDAGYVKDDDKKNLDATKLLESYRQGAQQHNEDNDGPPVKVVGWQVEPSYNESTHNLEWAVIFERAGNRFINHNVRILGRHGFMRVTLVEDFERLDATLPKFRETLAAFKYQTGESYAEYKPGDKVAKYGLTALVAGGAALGAAKLGLFAKLAFVFKKFFKLIILGIIAVAAALKKVVSGLFSRNRSDG